MTRIEFDEGFRRLERIFRNSDPLEDETRNEHFEAVKYFHVSIFEKAIDLVRDTHRFMPKPAEILEAIAEIGRQTPRATAEDLVSRCEKCGGDGIAGVAEPLNAEGRKKNAGNVILCDCPAGRKLAQGWKKRGMWKRGPISGATRRKTEPVAASEAVKDTWEAFKDPGDEEVPF